MDSELYAVAFLCAFTIVRDSDTLSSVEDDARTAVRAVNSSPLSVISILKTLSAAPVLGVLALAAESTEEFGELTPAASHALHVGYLNGGVGTYSRYVGDVHAAMEALFHAAEATYA